MERWPNNIFFLLHLRRSPAAGQYKRDYVLGLGTVELDVGAVGPQGGGGSDPFWRIGAADADGDLQTEQRCHQDIEGTDRCTDSFRHDFPK